MHKEHGVMALHIASVPFLNGRRKLEDAVFDINGWLVTMHKMYM